MSHHLATANRDLPPAFQCSAGTGRALLVGTLAAVLLVNTTGGAQPTAPEDARNPRPTALSLREEIAAATASVHAEHTRIIALGEQLQRQLEEDSSGALEQLDTINELDRRLTAVQPGESAALSLYKEILDQLVHTHHELATALDELHALSTIATDTPGLPPGAQGLAQLDRELGEYAAAQTKLTDAVRAAQELEAVLRRQRFEHDVLATNRLWTLNQTSLATLSESTRREVLGITRPGIAQLTAELDHLWLTARSYLRHRTYQLQKVPPLARDIFVLKRASTTALRLLLVLVLYVILRSRWQRALLALRRRLFRRLRTFAAKRRLSSFLGVVEAMSPATLFLAAVLALGQAAGGAASWPEVSLLLHLLVLLGCYRLAKAVLLQVITSLSRSRLSLVRGYRDKLCLSCVRLLRVLTVVWLGLLLTWKVLGHGWIYAGAVKLAWLVVALAGITLLARFKDEIAEAFAHHHPSGPLAGLVERTQHRWYGVFVTPAFFLWLLGRGIIGLGREFVLGFDQSRKALAFVFRRRVERTAEQQGYADTALEELSTPLLEAFSEEPVQKQELTVENFPGLTALGEDLTRWKAERLGGCLMLTGERGIGKSTWLAQVRDPELTENRVVLEDRQLTPKQLATTLSSALGLGAKGRMTLASLAKRLNDGPPRLLTLDLCQHLFLATVGGYEGIAAFVELVHSTNNNVFWVCAMSRYAWEHLQRVRDDLAVFDRHITLGPWNEQQIRQLIHRRLALSSVELSYQDLVVGRLEGVATQDRLIESEEGYTRLIWDYSDGNPRVALHLFLRSLVPVSETSARVRLFRAPPLEELEALDERAHFLLARVILHESLTLSEAVAVSRWSETLCALLLERLRALGVVQLTQHRYRVTTYWHRAGVRMLKRRNILHD